MAITCGRDIKLASRGYKLRRYWVNIHSPYRRDAAVTTLPVQAVSRARARIVAGRFLHLSLTHIGEVREVEGWLPRPFGGGP